MSIAIFKRPALAKQRAMLDGGKLHWMHHEGERLFVVSPPSMRLCDVRRALAQDGSPSPQDEPQVAMPPHWPQGRHWPRGIGAAVKQLREGATPRTVRKQYGLPQKVVTTLVRQLRLRETFSEAIGLRRDDSGSVEPEDALRAAKGIAIGVILGTLCWALIGLTVLG